MIKMRLPDLHASTPPRSTERPFIVPEGVDIEGAVHAHGAVVIEGTITGRVEAVSVRVSPHGDIHGVVAADEVVVEGHSSAGIYAKHIVLKAGSTVTGEVYHEDLEIEPGALFEGKSRRVREPGRFAPVSVEIVDEEQPEAQAAMTQRVLDRVA